MNGVAGANNAIKGLAKALAKGVEKKLLNTALTKGAFYPFLKSAMKWFGVKLTKEVLAKTVKSAIPVAGGIIGGGLTFVSFKPCCIRLKNALTDTLLSNPEHVSSTEEIRISWTERSMMPSTKTAKKVIQRKSPGMKNPICKRGKYANARGRCSRAFHLSDFLH